MPTHPDWIKAAAEQIVAEVWVDDEYGEKIDQTAEIIAKHAPSAALADPPLSQQDQQALRRWVAAAMLDYRNRVAMLRAAFETVKGSGALDPEAEKQYTEALAWMESEEAERLSVEAEWRRCGRDGLDAESGRGDRALLRRRRAGDAVPDRDGDRGGGAGHSREVPDAGRRRLHAGAAVRDVSTLDSRRGADPVRQVERTSRRIRRAAARLRLCRVGGAPMNAYAVSLPGDGSIEWVTSYDPALIGARMCLITPGGPIVIDSPGVLLAVTRGPRGGLMWWRAERFSCPEGLLVEREP